MSKRRSRAMDPDIKALKAADRAIRETQPRMRRALLVYLEDKYLRNPPSWLSQHDAEKFGPKPEVQP